jgi:hypothetical protein
MKQTNKGHLDLADGQLYYETAGKETPLVLSHAAFLDSSSMIFGSCWQSDSVLFDTICAALGSPAL